MRLDTPFVKKEDVGKRLVSERKRLGIKAVTVYEFLDIYQSTYKNYETGERDMPSSLMATLSLLGLDITFILTGKRTHLHGIAIVDDFESSMRLTDSDIKKLKTLVDIQKKLDNSKHRQLVTKQIDQILNKTDSDIF